MAKPRNLLTTQPRPAFHLMIKPHGPTCNLACVYCYYLPKIALYPQHQFRMSTNLLAQVTRQYIESQDAPEITFGWQGGEPLLMGLDFFRQAVALQQQAQRPNTRIINTVQTNGTLLNDAWCEFFAEHKFLIGVSLDGPQPLHDAYRIDPSGCPSHERVLAGIALLKKHHVEWNILTCVQAANADHPLDVYRFLRDEVGARFVQFIPVVQHVQSADQLAGSPVTSHSVTGAQYGKFLCAIFDEWVRHDVGRVFVQIFDVALGVWLGQPASLCVCAETCGAALVLEHNGDLFACDHFVAPPYQLGNLQQQSLTKLVNSSQQRNFGQAKHATLPAYCLACDVRFVCNGGCPKDRFIQTPDGQPGLNYLCEGYKTFFTHIARPMQVMASTVRAGRPAANIMRWIAQHPQEAIHA